MRFFALTIFCSLVLLLLSGKLSIANSPPENDYQKTQAAFYQTLEAIAAESSAVQISRLQDFVKRFPEFERGYLWLLDQFIITEQIQQAKNFFSELALQKPYYRNSQWMLAKINLLEKNPYAAAKAFVAALRATPPSPALLIDFLLFDNRHFGKFKDPSFVDSLALNDETTFYGNGTIELWVKVEEPNVQKILGKMLIGTSTGGEETGPNTGSDPFP